MSSEPRQPAALPVLTLFTKTPCPLCEDALDVLAPALHRVRPPPPPREPMISSVSGYLMVAMIGLR